MTSKYIANHVLVGVLFVFSGMTSLLGSRGDYKWLEEDYVRATLPLSTAERDRLSAADPGILRVRPVGVPTEESIYGENGYFSWPVGCKVEGALIAVQYRRLRHYPAPRYDNKSSLGYVQKSTDGGISWSIGRRLEEVRGITEINQDPDTNVLELKNRDGEILSNVIQFGNAIGVVGDRIYTAGPSGVFYSNDQGKSWCVTSSEAMTSAQVGDVRVNIGPRLLYHPRMGLLLLGSKHESVEGPANRFYVFSSADNGKTWIPKEISTSEEIVPAEPTGVVIGDKIYILTRNQRGQRQPGSVVIEVGAFPDVCNVIETNISTKRSPDTTDVIYNPFNQRIEAVITDRARHAIELWSIALQDFERTPNGWRREGVLLDTGASDGCHPAGSIVDEENNMQHVLIYAGRRNELSAVYVVSRSLDTGKLVKYLAK